jgi:putative DNA primase/helicase
MSQELSFSEKIAARLIEQIKVGTAPWQKPYDPGMGFLPINPVTGARYKAINVVNLMAQQYDDPRWMTYNQAKSKDYQVRRGEKATSIQYWKREERRPIKDGRGRPILDAEGKPTYWTIELRRPRVFLAYVFNTKQIDAIPELERKVYSWDSVQAAENILKASAAKIYHETVEFPHYRPSTDSIHMSPRKQFPVAANYYSSALHELGHWTGHETRLNRDLSGSFGSEGYAREELRAEIASMIVGADIGLNYDPNQHAAYAASWIQILQNDPLEIFRASADAEKIHQFIQSLQQKEKLTEVVEQYNRIVDGPEARKRLQATNPALVAARDKAYTELKRIKLEQELTAREQQRKKGRTRAP